MKLDKFDLKILEILRKDGRMPAAHLGNLVGLTSSPTWQRVRRLEKAGLIRGYHADIAIERLGKIVTVIVPVTLENHRAPDFRRFEQAIGKIPEIVECAAVGGGVDYVLRFVVPNIERYQEIVDELLQGDLGIHRYWTYIVTKPAKPYTGVPLTALLAAERKAEVE
ncbi:MAG TPA: Lrp/AsnC family transcriptional regulator [Woeseiaceae bacterium]|nr:Lrp/AsnC family transcriptional regulator [Woeseiaceae bacterium]